MTMGKLYLLIVLFLHGALASLDGGNGGNTVHDAENIVQETSTTAELIDIICSCKNEELVNSKPTDCHDILKQGYTTSGRYLIYPHDDGVPKDPIYVWCDMDTDGGGWTVLQKRQDGSVNFDLEWQDYRNGFGHIGGEYWLGNQNTYVITNQKEYELRVEAEEYDGTKHISTYDHFRLGGEDSHYTLYTGTYTGKQDVCVTPLGMESGAITDAMISASSEYSGATYKADVARLKLTTGSWISGTNAIGQFIQVYFGVADFRLVSGVILQGRYNAAQWVKKYKIRYEDGVSWKYITDASGNDKEFTGSTNQNGLATTYFDYPIRVRYIRIHPTEWQGHICLRFELLGCDGNFLAYQNNRKFSTKDADNDAVESKSCAAARGAWWYGDECVESDLNNDYWEGAGPTNRGIIWRNFDRKQVSIKRTEMKMRPVAHSEE